MKTSYLSRQSFIIVKKELVDLTQSLRNWLLKMWRPKDRSMTVYGMMAQYLVITHGKDYVIAKAEVQLPLWTVTIIDFCNIIILNTLKSYNCQ